MLSIIYIRQEKRREGMIKKLFSVLANETIQEELGDTKQYPTVAVISEPRCGSSFNCTTLHIDINLSSIKDLAKNGYTDSYYKGRRALISEYTLHNIHNETRFVIYHELKHFCDRIKYGQNPHKTFGEREAEGRADSFALSKLKRSV